MNPKFPKQVKAKNYKDAMTLYQQGLDAIEQTEGLPMHVDDVRIVVEAKSVLFSNRAQVMLTQELYFSHHCSHQQGKRENHCNRPHTSKNCKELKEYLMNTFLITRQKNDDTH